MKRIEITLYSMKVGTVGCTPYMNIVKAALLLKSYFFHANQEEFNTTRKLHHSYT